MIFLVKNGGTKEIPTGFSWTTFFFAFLPALIRGDIKWGLVMLVGSVFTSGISSLVFPFIYNKLYIKNLIENGYIPKTEEDIDLLNQMDIRYPKEGKQKSEASIINSGKENNTIHSADELKKWMELLKDGSITKDEYESIKAKILQNN
ncbi:SHOCT domain-containing protein [Psychrilyobacter atlanticus]|uniref:SHOCT domain-containing protein n=1 Tax=Psychrilyobacter atlanticus TaxID=271091 RepID=UPI0003F8F153|nr:SHOCT domain-containing protein [Psychrilyobacter atlanticus]